MNLVTLRKSLEKNESWEQSLTTWPVTSGYSVANYLITVCI